MKRLASNIAWTPAQDAEVAALLRAEGFDGIEVALTRDWPDLAKADVADVRAFAARWRDEGLPIGAAQALLFGRPELVVFGTADVRRQTIDYLRLVFDLCAAAGARAMVFGSPRNRRVDGRPPAEARGIAVDFFGELAGEAEARQLALVIEANPPAYGADFVTTAAQAIDLVRAVDRPGFRLHLDLGCLRLAGEPVAETVIAAAPLLAHAHASSPHLAPLLGPKPNQDDELDAFVSALSGSGYAGAVSLEMRRSDDDQLGAFAQSAARLARSMQDAAPGTR
jgi:sugar phosphate isomerase/epimerase